jgi:phosphatidylglycerophosphate synthase
MVVPDLIFDIVLFGVLLLALLLDNVFPFSPQLHGSVTLLAVGLATYVAAQEMSEALDRRKWWAQESLATALAIATLAFVYYFKRNDSDLALLGLSIALMMTALMVLISVIAALGTAWNESSVRPMEGWSRRCLVL